MITNQITLSSLNVPGVNNGKASHESIHKSSPDVCLQSSLPFMSWLYPVVSIWNFDSRAWEVRSSV